MNPKWPVYIVSKGRWESRLTMKALDTLGVPYYVIVERDELWDYECALERPESILVLPDEYLKAYDVCDDLEWGRKSVGPGAARNYAWDHAFHKVGSEWHWVLDDNIAKFGRINNNLYVPVSSGTIFRCAEDFVGRYDNVALAGFNYDFFAKTRTKLLPFRLNTRIYSCLLINNKIPYRWRGRYNEDTDLSLRALKDGWCTILFNAFIQEKATTQTVKGGNSTEFYDHEGTLPKSKMIADLHPDVAKVVWRFNRWHHHVNYNTFKRNRLKFKEGYTRKKGINNYGMKLIEI